MTSPKTTHRRAIGDDPLDVVVPAAQPKHTPSAQAPAPASRARDPRGRKAVADRPSADRKIRATIHLPVDLLDEARDATVFLSGPPARLTLAGLTEHALRQEVARLKKLYNKGKNFPKRSVDLKGGRPIGS